MSHGLIRRADGVVNVSIPTDAQGLGQLLADSGFFSDAKGAAQAAVKVMAGAELGFGPIASMTGVYIVKGRVTLSANLIAAAIGKSKKYHYRVREHDESVCAIEFFEDGESLGVSRYAMDDARKAGLAGSDTWKKHPKNMLFARALSNGAKWYCPDVFGGPIYTPDELGAVVDGETGEVIEGTATEAGGELLDREEYHALVDLYKAAGEPREALEDVLNEVGAPAREHLAWRLRDCTAAQGVRVRGWLEERVKEMAA